MLLKRKDIIILRCYIMRIDYLINEMIKKVDFSNLQFKSSVTKDLDKERINRL